MQLYAEEVDSIIKNIVELTKKVDVNENGVYFIGHLSDAIVALRQAREKSA